MTPPPIDREQVEHEARARIFWGDPPEEVTKYLMMQGIECQEASGMVEAMFRERAAAIRGTGFRKMLIGFALACVPVAAWLYFSHLGFFSVKLFAVTVVIGVWGAWILLKGSIMFFLPKSEPGDVADQ